MLALFLSRLNKDHWSDFMAGETIVSPRYQFNSSVLAQWFGVDPKQLFSTLEKPASRLSSRTIGLVNEDSQKFSYTPLFKKIEYDDGVLHIVPNDEMIHAYLGVSQGHAKMDHRVFRMLKSEHSKRLYAMLSRFKDPATKLHPQTIEELHSFFGLLDSKGMLVKKSYQNNKVFMERCIRNSINEINKYDNLIQFNIYKLGNSEYFGFEPIKTGRKITSIRFIFSWLTDEKMLNMELEKLKNQPNPINELTLIYELVHGFVPEQEGNPTISELTMLQHGFGQLITMGKFIDQAFMVNFNLAKQEAAKNE